MSRSLQAKEEAKSVRENGYTVAWTGYGKQSHGVGTLSSVSCRRPLYRDALRTLCFPYNRSWKGILFHMVLIKYLSNFLDEGFMWLMV